MSARSKPGVILFFPVLEEGKKYHWFPNGPLAIAARLAKAGVPVRIIDERITPDYDSVLPGLIEGCACAGISSFTGFQLSGALRFARRMRKLAPAVPLIWGGPHVSALPLESLESPLVDACVVGYADRAFPEAATRILGGEAIADISGIRGFAAKGSREASVIPAPADPGLPELPPLPYELLDTAAYVNPERMAVMYLSSYGCPSRCTFCSTGTNRNWGRIPAEKVLADLKRLLSLHPFREIVLYDSTFLASRPHWEPIAAWLAGERPFERWICDSRAPDLAALSASDLDGLESSGLDLVVVGLESAAPRIVELHKKGKKHLEHYRKVMEMMAGRRARVISGVIFGNPTETVEDLRLTFSFMSEMAAINPAVRFSVTNFGALPGTELFAMVRDRLGFAFPESLEEWAGLGAKTHYAYNRLDYEFPYVEPSGRAQYCKEFRAFWEKNGKLLV